MSLEPELNQEIVVIIRGFNNSNQAKEFINWYSGSGEQNACEWFECRKSEGTLDVDSMITDCHKTFPLIERKSLEAMIYQLFIKPT